MSRSAKLMRDNPGAYSQHVAPSLKQLISKTIRGLKAGHYKKVKNEWVAETANLINDFLSHKSPPKFQCSCCGFKAYAFVHRSNEFGIAWNSSCPQCDSRSRHRGLALFLPLFLENRPSFEVIHFAPEPILMQVIKSFPKLTYKTADLFLTDVDYPAQNLEALSFQDGLFDLVLCNHVLEHLQRDDLAVREIARILKKNGKALMTIPGNWNRKKTLSFIQSSNGHWREYGMEVRDLFLAYFSKVDVLEMHNQNQSKDGLLYGIRQKEPLFVCYK